MYFSKDVLLIADKGYIGMNKIHGNSLVPRKSTKRHKLTKEDKKYNSIISRRRIYIEHVNRHIKKFRILYLSSFVGKILIGARIKQKKVNK